MRSLKSILAVVLLSVSAVSFAAPSVKIDSYTYTGQGDKTAELCGTVSDVTSPTTFVQITVDHGSKRPAIYNTIAGPNGKFCTVVVTYYGTAVAVAL